MANSLKYSTEFNPGQLAAMKGILRKNGWETEDTIVNGIELYAFGYGYAIADWKKIWSEKPFPEDFPYIPLLMLPHHKLLGKIQHDINHNPDRKRHMEKMHEKAYLTYVESYQTDWESQDLLYRYKKLMKEAQV
jgi:hypothetical protein